MTQTPKRQMPAGYRLRVAGHLDHHWSPWFDDLTLTHESDGTTSFSGFVSDQAELHGLLPACQGELRPAVHSKSVPRRARFGLIPDEFFNSYPGTPRWSDGSFTATFWWPYPSAVVHASAEA
jgi:hypothetical protein